MSTKREAYNALVLDANMDAKYASLMDDYVVIQHDYAELKDGIQVAKMKKAYLLAEVRFLRRRLKKLKEIPSELKENQTVQAISQCALGTCDGKTNSQTSVPPSLVLSANNVEDDWSPMLLDPLMRNSSESLKPIIDSFGLLSSQKTSSLSNIHNTNLTAPAKKRKPSSLSNRPSLNLTAPKKNRKPSALSKTPDPNFTASTKRKNPSSLSNTPDLNLTAPTKMRKVSWLDEISLECD